jgi:hypothetical protein
MKACQLTSTKIQKKKKKKKKERKTSKTSNTSKIFKTSKTYYNFFVQIISTPCNDQVGLANNFYATCHFPKSSRCQEEGVFVEGVN